MAVVGIDVSKKTLDVLWLRDLESLKVKTKSMPNTEKGFTELLAWLAKNTDEPADQLQVFMEATGVYHESLAYHLHEQGVQVFVLNPAHVRDYARSIGSRGKTDKQDSFVLARYGATQQPRRWEPEAAEVRHLKALLSRLDALKEDIQREMNRREKAGFSGSNADVIVSIDTILGALNKEAERLENDIDRHIDQNPGLKKDRGLLRTIHGIGDVLSRDLLALLHSRNFTSARQCAAFSGLVPVHWESGSSVRGRPHMSKTGQPKLRAKLFMGSMTATRYNPDVKALYERLIAKGKARKCALGAAMRKLLQIAYGVLKTQTMYQQQQAV